MIDKYNIGTWQTYKKDNTCMQRKLNIYMELRARDFFIDLAHTGLDIFVLCGIFYLELGLLDKNREPHFTFVFKFEPSKPHILTPLIPSI